MSDDEQDEDMLVSECRGRLEVAEAEITNLRAALVTARRIGAAMGIVMARHGVTDDDAFTLLKIASQLDNRKVRDIAEEVILTGAVPEV